MADRAKKDIEILIIKLGALGDIFLCLRYFELIREIHPHARITMMTTAPFHDLCIKNPAFDEVVIIKRWGARDITGWLHFIKLMRRKKFSLVYDMQSNTRTSIMRRLSPKKARQSWVTFWGPLSQQPAISYKGPVFDPGNKIDLRPKNLDWLSQGATINNFPDSYALLVPGCAPQHPYKRWPQESYAALAGRLADTGITPILIGGKAEQDTLDFITAIEPRSINLANKTSFSDIVHLAKNAVCAVGNDTGPMHIIALAGCNTLSLFSGKTDPRKCSPSTPAARWLQKNSISDITDSAAFDEIQDWLKGHK